MFLNIPKKLFLGCFFSVLILNQLVFSEEIASFHEDFAESSLTQPDKKRLTFEAPTDEVPTALLQQRVVALSQAIELRFRNELEKLKAAKHILSLTLDDWNHLSNPSEIHEQQLQNWLTISMQRMMLGRTGKMPAPLFFAENELNEYPAANTGLQTVQSGNDSVSPLQLIEPIEKQNQTKRHAAKPIQKPLPPKQSERSRWSKHPSSAPLEWTDPFKNQISMEDPFSQGSSVRHEVQRPLTDGSFADDTVSVNHSELIAAIRGYNLQVRNVNRRLQQVNQMSVIHLLKIVDELERLWDEKAFLHLYLEGLTDEGRQLMPRLLSAELAQELVLRQAADLLADDSVQNQSDRAALQGINRKLSQYK